jgi:GNAT superfamily N-acetyltransferase
MPLEIRRLLPEDDRSTFESGDLDLDRFFWRFAGQNQFRHHIGTTYVAVEDGVLVGFATVTASELLGAELPAARRKKLPKYPLPVLRLARLAVSRTARGRGVGSALLRAVFVLAHRMADDYGCVGVAVDAKEGAVAFYERLGFFALEVERGQLGDRPEPQPMFLELGAIPRPEGV